MDISLKYQNNPNDFNILGLFTDEGDTYLVKIIRRGTNFVEIKRLMTADGYLTDDFDPEEVDPKTIVSDKPLKNIYPKIIYHFASDRIGYKLKASSFVTHGTPLVSACSHGLGSGIYGLFFTNENLILPLKSNIDQIVYKISYKKPFIIQDSYHLNSLITTSMSTNRYIDHMINKLNNIDTISYIIILNNIRSNPIDNLIVLWYIVFLRSKHPIALVEENKHLLEMILANYIWDYFTDQQLRDTINGSIIHELPINSIMRIFGYDGIIGNDNETNSWSRGCVAYNYSDAQVLEGYGTRRCIG